MKKKLVMVLTAVALISVAAAGIGTASAYFTTFARAYGTQTVKLGDETTIKENYESFKKTVRIDNNKKSATAVYVRAKAFAGSEFYGLTYEGSGWALQSDGYYHYASPVEPGSSTADLAVKIVDKATGKDPIVHDGHSMNIVIVYETTPAIKDGGETYQPADWTRTAKEKETGGES